MCATGPVGLTKLSHRIRNHYDLIYICVYRAQKVEASEKALSVICIAHNLRRHDSGLEADSPVHKVRPC